MKICMKKYVCIYLIINNLAHYLLAIIQIYRYTHNLERRGKRGNRHRPRGMKKSASVRESVTLTDWQKMKNMKNMKK